MLPARASVMLLTAFYQIPCTMLVSQELSQGRERIPKMGEETLIRILQEMSGVN